MLVRPFSIYLFLALFISVGLVPLQGHAEERVYTIGVVPQFSAKRLHSIWQPILDELEREVGYRFSLSGAANIPAFEKQFMQGEFDFAYMNPYHVIIAEREQGYVPLLRDVGKRLHGILVVSKDSPYQSPKDLAGQRVAFPSPNALGASLIMRADFADVFKTEIKPDYVKTHSSVYLNVALGIAEAGGGVAKTFNQQPDHVKDKLRIIYKTRETAPHPMAVHPRVPREVREAFVKGMISLSKTTKGKELFANIPVKELGVASFDDYRPLLDMKLDRLYEK